MSRLKSLAVFSPTVRRICAASVTVITATYAIIAADRNTDWQDDPTLWSRTVETSPQSDAAHYNLAIMYAEFGKPDEARQHFLQAPEADSNLQSAKANLETLERLERERNVPVNSEKGDDS